MLYNEMSQIRRHHVHECLELLLRIHLILLQIQVLDYLPVHIFIELDVLHS